ncbi:MAG: hypothetical protein HYZ36_04040 [Pedosphaera parvula]|nr:hypothetical protein [Pedosphaera parvula]
MCTTWSGSEQICRVLLGEDQSSLANAKEIVRAMRSCLEKMRGGKDGQSSADKF